MTPAGPACLHQAWTAVAAALLVAIAIYLLYTPALPGFLLFDDRLHLDALSRLSDFESVLNYILMGHAGPLGRPVSITTFALQAGAWPEDIDRMLRLNFLIHALAVLCVFALSWALVAVREPSRTSEAAWIGVGAAALWGLSPFLATTHLMLIQRMTSLSGLFTLAGLAAFVLAHLVAGRRPWLARGLLVLGTGGGTVLAAFAKENGVLLPLLALVLSWAWIPPQRRPAARADRGLVLGLTLLPSLALLGYLLLVTLPDAVQQGYPDKYFQLGERLMSQPMVLLDYLRNLFLPRAALVSPFTDRYPLPEGWQLAPTELLAALFWPLVLAVAWGVRRQLPALFFGLLFFLCAHLLESSIIGLELYFAHRNYVPSFGLYFALVYSTASLPRGYLRLARFGLAAYAALFAGVLLQVTSGWEQSLETAERWHRARPYSTRAVQFLANRHLAQGDVLTAQHLIDAAAAQRPEEPVLQVQRMLFCNGEGLNARASLSAARLRSARYEPSAATLLLGSTRADPGSACQGWRPEALIPLADALLANSAYQRRTIEPAKLIAVRGMIALRAGAYDTAADWLRNSFAVHPDIEIALFAATALHRAGRIDVFRQFLTEVEASAAQQGRKAPVWQAKLREFEAYVARSR